MRTYDQLLTQLKIARLELNQAKNNNFRLKKMLEKQSAEIRQLQATLTKENNESK